MQNGVENPPEGLGMTCSVCGGSDPHGPHDMAAREPDAPLPVPTSVTRQQLIDAVKALGLDPDTTSHIQLGVKDILVMVMVEGTKYPKGLMDAGILVAGTMVQIPVKDDDA